MDLKLMTIQFLQQSCISLCYQRGWISLIKAVQTELFVLVDDSVWHNGWGESFQCPSRHKFKCSFPHLWTLSYMWEPLHTWKSAGSRTGGWQLSIFKENPRLRYAFSWGQILVPILTIKLGFPRFVAVLHWKNI